MALNMHEPPRLLFAGVDTLYAAVQGTLPLETLERLAVARDIAKGRRDNEPEIIELGPDRTAFRLDAAGQRGGYHYRLSLPDPLSPVIAVRHNPIAAEWNGFISIGSLSLLGLGHNAAFAKAMELLAVMEFRWLGYSLNRVDYAMDFLAPGFEVDPARFVAPNRTTGRPHLGKTRHDSEEGDAVPGWHFQPILKGRRYESATLGKLPRLQTIVYDKRREAIDQRKAHWFDVWGIDRADADARVWRIEVRAGGEHLKYKWQVRQIEDVDRRLPSIVAKGLHTFRCIAPEENDTNVSRRPLDPLWAAATEHAKTVMLRNGPALDPDALRAIDRKQVEATLSAQIVGCGAALAHLRGVGDLDEDEAPFVDLLCDVAQHALGDAKKPVQGAMKRAAKRYG